ncbi:MAG: diphosphate--fructose-6-phosphate 1-phosphotransferase [Ruminococcus sp.]|jgi:6-phosphofructokinase 1|nr:diphosphate--fructose-6-phosphate 1-phosphotransferase [Ruminococcus sp.]
MNIIIAQSGGPTAVINSSLYGVYNEALRSSKIGRIYGAKNGIEGIISGDFVDLTNFFQNNDAALLKQTPGAILGSCRYKLDTEKDFVEIDGSIEEYDVGAIFYIGGNDSMDTVVKLSDHFTQTEKKCKVIGIPKTIDNDLYGTDHTPGFASALKFVCTAISEIALDSSAYNLESVTIIEIMGRDTGWLAAGTCVLKEFGLDVPHLTYLPESEFDVFKFTADVREKLLKKHSVIVAVSEGVSAAGRETSAFFDSFGHTKNAGIGKKLENIIEEKLEVKCRSIELNTLQRCAGHIASLADINEAELLGKAAVRAALSGDTGKMMTILRTDSPADNLQAYNGNKYEIKIGTIPAEEVANRIKYFPKEWIGTGENSIKGIAAPYFMPLIQGELNLVTENGLPKHLNLI